MTLTGHERREIERLRRRHIRRGALRECAIGIGWTLVALALALVAGAGVMGMLNLLAYFLGLEVQSS